MALTIVYCETGGVGYSPLGHMARLAAELLSAELVVVRARQLGRAQRLRAALRPRWRAGTRDCLLICPSPTELTEVLHLQDSCGDFRRVAAWVFDSFWTDRIPRFAKLQRQFDHIFVTEPEDLTHWRETVRAEVSWLPWGCDALSIGADCAVRPIDLLRFGRQPAEWDDDRRTDAACSARSLRFLGRPQMLGDASANELLLAEACRQSKLTLSFSNRVSPSAQTHPTREYITSRWTLALANGAIVAGVPPRTEALQSLLWPEALLPLPSTDLRSGLDAIEDAVATWTPARARYNHRKALERLDWRWRLHTIADALDLHSLKLTTELAALASRIDTLAQPPHEELQTQLASA